jgi:DNA-binding winged helix-turn-helix (wHTH) protein/tetratricopeptide (TPR) repeat protein
MRFRFRDCVVDADRFELVRAGEPLPVQPKVLRLLVLLLENRDRTLSKEEILDALWPGIAVGEGSLTRAVSLARSALGDGAEVIRTVRGRGYRIGVPVSVEGSGAAPAEAPRHRSGFLCRDKEMALARDALLEALAGRGRVLLLVGEPGIGKTRMAEEIAALARERGARAFWGRCQDAEPAPAFWPWVQILRARIAESKAGGLHAQLGSRAAEIAELVPEIRDELPELPVPQVRDPVQARFALFDAVAALLRAAAAEQPLVLVLDDLQSADEASLALLRFLGTELREWAALVVATYRDAQLRPGHPLERTLAELVRSQRPGRTILLHGLSEGCVRRFTEQVAGIVPEPELVEALHRRSEGNPLFLVELLQWLQGREASWPAAAGWESSVPEGVRHVIGRRLDGLSPACNEILAAAAVIGRDFQLPVLAAVSGLAEADLLARLGEAEQARIVERARDTPGRFRFSHGLIAETLRERLGTPDRVRLHRRTAEVLENLYTPRALARTDRPAVVAATHFAELAHHYREAAGAGDVQKAFNYSVGAGEHAAEVLAFAEASLQFERALALLDLAGAGSQRRGDLLLSLAAAQHRSGAADQAAATLGRAIELARASDDRALLAEAAIALHGQAVGGNVFRGDHERLQVLEEALVRLDQTDVPLRARLVAALAAERLLQGDAAGGRPLVREALQAARRVGGSTLWNVLCQQRLWWLAPDQAREREALIEETFAVARESSDPQREFVARFDFRLSDAIERADPEVIDREIEACDGLAERLRQPIFRWSVTRVCAARALWQGRVSEAEELLRRARDEGRRAGEQADLSYHSGLFALRRMQGRVAELEAGLRADHRLPLERGHKHGALALMLAESGRTEEAQRELARLAHGGFSSVRRDSNFTYNLALLAETCALVSNEEKAEPLYEVLTPWAGRYLAIPTLVAAGCASRFLGLLATSLRRWDDAQEHFATALAVEQRMKARPFEAYVERDWARMLSARGAAGDRVAARRRLDRFAEIARELGLGAGPP